MQYLANISAFTSLQNRCGIVNAKDQPGSDTLKDNDKASKEKSGWWHNKPDWAGMAAYAASALFAYSPLFAAGLLVDKMRHDPPEEPIPVVEVVDQDAGKSEQPDTLFSFSDQMEQEDKEDIDNLLLPTKNTRKVC